MAFYKSRTYTTEEKMLYAAIKSAETIEKYTELGWPDLQGTDKQIPWAMGIKMKAVNYFQEIENINCFKQYIDEDIEFYNNIINDNNIETIKEYMMDNFIMKCNNCSYLIKHRFEEPRKLLIEFIRESWNDGIIKGIE